ncbi:radical SAM protein|nr:radical SAM protein [archaeon]
MRTIILHAGRCGWANCVFCGWGKEEVKISADELIREFMKQRGDDGVKLYCSGSLLDLEQFPLKFIKHLAKEMRGKRLIIESRPEYVTKKSLKLFKGVLLTVAMGLEAADNEVLKKLKKGITIEQFADKAALIHEVGFKVKGYVLVNPPHDYPGLLDKTVSFGRKHCDELVLINTYPHSRSELFDYWLRGEWQPLSEEEFYKLTEKYKDVQLEPNNYAFTPKFPPDKRVDLKGVGVEFINHPHFNVWQYYLANLYKKPEHKTIALFLPCSKRKPYYKSRTHRSIRRMITGYEWYKNLHLIVISNPGVIPVEFSDKYPFNAYDWDERKETPAVMREYMGVNKQRIKNYLENHEYEKILSYFKPESESGLALKEACEELGLDLVKLVNKDLYFKHKDKRNPLIHPLMLRAFKKRISEVLS